MGALALGFALMLGNESRADGRRDYLEKQLKQAKDPRARAQAALLLGATEDPEAVNPLCLALYDAVDLVRVAAAKALAELAEPAALSCLDAHARASNAEVKRGILSAISTLEAIKNAKPRFYMYLARPEDKSRTLAPDLLERLDRKLRRRLGHLGVAFAPPGETKEAARTQLRSRKLKGFALLVQLQRLPNEGIAMSLLCFSYPDRALKGEVSLKASGAPPMELLDALVPQAVDEAADTFEWRGKP